MPKFALKNPYFIIMVCMVVVVVGITNIASMPVDLFPKIDNPVVVVASFYSGMPPQQIEADITDTLVYLILMAQFTSLIDPFIILMAIPPGLAGVVLILLVTHSTLNIMSLMGVIMMTGIVVSNSILIVECGTLLHEEGRPLLEAVVQACKIRLRPILMTSLATLLGMIPMALGLESGSEQYAPLARAIIGGLGVSVVVTVFLVPAVYLVVHSRWEKKGVFAGEI